MGCKKWIVVFGAIGLGACESIESPPTRVTIGVVSYGENERSSKRFQDLEKYLGQQLQSVIELEPAYNEIKALQQIRRKSWDVVFAPPGLAALAISQYQYTPILPLEGTLDTRSILVVRKDSPIKTPRQLEGKSVALGQVGSATGYYLPLYNLYGLTLARVRLAPNPRDILSLVATKQVDAGALSLEQYNHYRNDFPNARFRVLFSDSRPVPTGSILVSPNVELREAENLQVVFRDTPPAIASLAGFIPNAEVPDYSYLMRVVDRVSQISERVRQEPAPLREENIPSSQAK
jgi:phosphonate transport system substrate-binding protein